MADKPEREALVFYADSRFEKLAQRPGAVAREQALANAQSHVEDLRSDFLVWLDQELQQLRAALAQVEVDRSDMTVLDRANNNSSQLRDIGATMGFELVTFVAGSLCAMLDAVRGGAGYDKDMIDCHINALFLVKTEPYRNLRPHQVPEMSFGLRRIVELAMQTAPDESGHKAERPADIQILLPEDDDSAH